MIVNRDNEYISNLVLFTSVDVDNLDNVNLRKLSLILSRVSSINQRKT